MSIVPLRRVHRGAYLDYSQIDRAYTTQYLAGYSAALDWFTSGAPVTEVEGLLEIFQLNSRPGSPNYEAGASVYLDAEEYPSFLISMNARTGPYEQKFGPRFPVKDGKQLARSFHEDYGGDLSEWWFNDQTFLINPTRPFDDGILTAVAHVNGVV